MEGEQGACPLTSDVCSRCRKQGRHPFVAYEHAILVRPAIEASLGAAVTNVYFTYKKVDSLTSLYHFPLHLPMAQPSIHEQNSVLQCGEASASRRDDTFYLDVVTFRVSDTLFRVPRYAFEGGSAVFASMFTLPPGQGLDTEGCSDEHPVVLEGATDEEFRQFLRILLPRNALRPDNDLTQEQWTAVLKLATMWDFDDVRQLAVLKMGKMDMTRDQRFRLGRAYSVSKWYHGVLKDIVQRVEALTKEDVDLVGIDIALGIASNRERIAPSIYGQWLYEERRKVPSTVYKEGLPCAVEQLVRDFFPLD
ncbi:uncharacterized protein SCHCODRAFT_02630911 [Schizophyllum commune H4-8]|nr:uncharacterized protein SCHCODRAFT_02630911 [Schizophyllum commune H4-8]KAI5890119.1 hypothetical protein SCHCODRAFT_02630911 [Schizophyllum commune H4-8]